MSVEIVLSNIKQMRQKKGLSQKQLGEKIGMSQQGYALIEKNKRSLDYDILEKIADVLGVNIAYLVNEFPFDDVIPYKDKQGNIAYDTIPFDTNTAHETSDAINDFSKTDILDSFEKLNNKGKKIAAERVEELTEIERYTSKKD